MTPRLLACMTRKKCLAASIRLLEEKAREEQKEFCMKLLGSRLPGQC